MILHVVIGRSLPSDRLTLKLLAVSQIDVILGFKWYDPKGFSGGIRMADELDHYELELTEAIGTAIAPLVDRLRRRTIGRRGYETLVALVVENALTLGDADATAAMLRILDQNWRRCPARYVPDLSRRVRSTRVRDVR